MGSYLEQKRSGLVSSSFIAASDAVRHPAAHAVLIVLWVVWTALSALVCLPFAPFVPCGKACGLMKKLLAVMRPAINFAIKARLYKIQYVPPRESHMATRIVSPFLADIKSGCMGGEQEGGRWAPLSFSFCDDRPVSRLFRAECRAQCPCFGPTARSRRRLLALGQLGNRTRPRWSTG